MAALEDSLVEVHKSSAGGLTGHWRVGRISSEARQLVGQWPSAEAYADRLVRALEVAADQAPDGSARQSKLKAAALAFGNVDRDPMVEVTAQVISKSMGTA